MKKLLSLFLVLILNWNLSSQNTLENYENIIENDKKNLDQPIENSELKKKVKLGDHIVEINKGNETLYNTYSEKVIDYHIWSLENRRSTLSWHLLSTKIIFIVVVLIVICGLYFSWIQFRKMNNLIKKNDQGESEQASDTVHSFKASLQGIEISSSFIGLIILVISMAFFYLYLIHVYPIEIIKERKSIQSNPEAEKN